MKKCIFPLRLAFFSPAHLPWKSVRQKKHSPKRASTVTLITLDWKVLFLLQIASRQVLQRPARPPARPILSDPNLSSLALRPPFSKLEWPASPPPPKVHCETQSLHRRHVWISRSANGQRGSSTKKEAVKVVILILRPPRSPGSISAKLCRQTSTVQTLLRKRRFR